MFINSMNLSLEENQIQSMLFYNKSKFNFFHLCLIERVQHSVGILSNAFILLLLVDKILQKILNTQ
jgi:hypothetical protein